MINPLSGIFNYLGRRWRGATGKMLAVAGSLLLLLLLGAAVGTTLYQTKSVGDKMVEIAEHNLPLVRSVTQLTVHQLEQAIALEQSLRYGEEMQSDNAKRSFFDPTVERFEKYAGLTDGEFREARELVSKLLDQTLTRRERVEYTRVIELLEELDAAHATYEARARKVHTAMRRGDLAGALEIVGMLHAEELELDTRLEQLLDELQDFVQESAIQARQQEMEALGVVVALTVLTALFAVVGAILIVWAAAKTRKETP